MAASKWKKAKEALGLKTCFYIHPETMDEPSPTSTDFSGRLSGTDNQRSLDRLLSLPTTPTSSSATLRLSKSFSKSSKKACAICLTTMKPGQGHAIFTAECSHTFHFHCITSNVKHGNQICPVCRAKWKEVPFQSPSASDLSHDALTTLVRRLHLPTRLDTNRQFFSPNPVIEPVVFDDDEQLIEVNNENSSSTDNVINGSSMELIEVTTFAEISAVPRSASQNNFAVLVHLKAPVTGGRVNCNKTQDDLTSQIKNARAPVDLVTVLDVSGSMAGTKLALLKRAMGFVIQNLGPSDRLSVIAFSSTARRLFHLTRMTDSGRHQALQAVNCLITNGGTNIAEGLKKGVKVIIDSKWKNPVCSIILLSDGQDTYTIKNPGGTHQADYKLLLPSAISQDGGTGLQIPVHAFGFGTDHDAVLMHSIAEMSGGTFSFIETESVIQDAFAQCIGGLLSVVVQQLQVEIACVHPNLQITSIKAGSYKTRTEVDARVGFIDLGDLYAEEERDFLVTVNLPIDKSNAENTVLKVKCMYRDPITKEMVTLEEASEMKIQRPEKIVGKPVVSMEVDRQRNRFRTAEAMSEAKVAAENGDLANAVSVLQNCIRMISETLSAQAGDKLCISLCAELKEMQERMASRRVYETSGRAYVLSGLSSHSWQRATARGDSTDSTSLVQAYQTPSMVDMVTQSQTMVFGNPSSQLPVRPTRSFSARPQPR